MQDGMQYDQIRVEVTTSSLFHSQLKTNYLTCILVFHIIEPNYTLAMSHAALC